MKAPEPEVHKCHLHKKANKACKFCKAYLAWQEDQARKVEEAKKAAIEHMQNSQKSAAASSDANGKLPIPIFSQFPAPLASKITGSEGYMAVSIETDIEKLVGHLQDCESADLVTVSNVRMLDGRPTPFMVIVYRMLQLQLTAEKLADLIKHECEWIRCAACFYVRLGVAFERYWEFLGDILDDTEHFVPFRDPGNIMTVGEYVEGLLMKVEYGEGGVTKFRMPWISVAAKTQITGRVLLNQQFKMRYAQNLETDHFAKADVSVEICSIDGEWRKGLTKAPISREKKERGETLSVMYPDGDEELVSLGRVIIPDSTSSPSDLTRHRGPTIEDLVKKHAPRAGVNALAEGKNYCKPMKNVICVQGMNGIIVGGKRDANHRECEDSDDEYEEQRVKKMRQEREEELQKNAKLASIEAVYCAKMPEEKTIPDNLRLG